MRETAPVIVLVVGGTGELGSEVVRLLTARGVDVRAMARHHSPPSSDDGGYTIVRADLADAATLPPVFAGVHRVFLISSPTRDQVRLETNAIVAAERAGVEQVVKVSNLPIVGLDSGLHGNHRAVERRLAQSAVASTVLQPSFFASVLRRQAALIRRGRLVLPTGDGRIAWIDPRDIAAVGASVLAEPAPRAGVLRLTGPEALTADDLVRRVGLSVGREITLVQPNLTKWRAELLAGGMDPWLVESTVHLYEAVADGALADVCADVERVLGRPARPIHGWLREVLAPCLRRDE
jgi:uncharacterized protein YbjT (DUF2867 family)